MQTLGDILTPVQATAAPKQVTLNRGESRSLVTNLLQNQVYLGIVYRVGICVYGFIFLYEYSFYTTAQPETFLNFLSQM